MTAKGKSSGKAKGSASNEDGTAGDVQAAQPGEEGLVGQMVGVNADGEVASPQPGQAGQKASPEVSGRVDEED